MKKHLFNADTFGKHLRVRMAEKRQGMRATAKEIGCSLATVSRVCSGKPPDVENYLRIQKWMGK